MIAVDHSPVQIAALELCVVAYRYLSYPELLALIGIRPSDKRLTLHSILRPRLSTETPSVWDAHADAIEDGLGKAGKFEHYLDIFRCYVLPLTHSRQQLEQFLGQKLLASGVASMGIPGTTGVGDYCSNSSVPERLWGCWGGILAFSVMSKVVLLTGS